MTTYRIHPTERQWRKQVSTARQLDLTWVETPGEGLNPGVEDGMNGYWETNSHNLAVTMRNVTGARIETVEARTTETCQWLVERASGNPEPDSYADTITIGACGEPIPLGAPRGLCTFHNDAMDLPMDEYERISEAHGGNAFS